MDPQWWLAVSYWTRSNGAFTPFPHRHATQSRTHISSRRAITAVEKAKAAPEQASGEAMLSAQKLKDELGLDTWATVDAPQAFETFWPFLPANIKVRACVRACIDRSGALPPPHATMAGSTRLSHTTPPLQESLYPRALVLSTHGSRMAVSGAPGQPLDFDDLKCACATREMCVCVWSTAPTGPPN